jgi:superfamily I DNA and/or RNA helicase
VPLISTTFASVGRMLGSLPPEALGWLLIDEAGQAVPQAAVGAIKRARRAIVVGDPIQIEPVVVLPNALTEAICEHHGVDGARFSAPAASAQSLADAATDHVGAFGEPGRSRDVGVPLLVHRRCAEPMFTICNAVAYDNLMVCAKAPRDSAVRNVLGQSAWFHVEGDAEEKWCPQEGRVAVSLLRKLLEAGVEPDIHIITPFVVVAENLRRLVRESHVVDRWGDESGRWTTQRIGTVHTVQGREAEAVIFVLGAPDPRQRGAREWAGQRPNLLNVAVSRAKEALYVVGNRDLWRTAGVFRELDARMP